MEYSDESSPNLRNNKQRENSIPESQVEDSANANRAIEHQICSYCPENHEIKTAFQLL